jgi:hypothetical protein
MKHMQNTAVAVLVLGSNLDQMLRLLRQPYEAYAIDDIPVFSADAG